MTFTSPSTTSSSLSSRKFHLDESSTTDILVYKMRCGYEITSQKKLCQDLDKDPKWRCSRKPIPRFTSRLDVLHTDLFNEPQRSEYAKYPNARSSLASVGLPTGVHWRRMLLGHFADLYILSPEGSPSSSSGGAGSPESGSPTSPGNTWNLGGER